VRMIMHLTFTFNVFHVLEYTSPFCRVIIDNDSNEDATLVKVLSLYKIFGDNPDICCVLLKA
jgi:hypothetical protein